MYVLVKNSNVKMMAFNKVCFSLLSIERIKWEKSTKIYISFLFSIPLSLVNNRTFGTFFNPMMWWINIEVSNNFVDKSSWESSTCCPWCTFDPLSKSPSTRDSWITLANFRVCSNSKSHSHACLYHYGIRIRLLSWSILDI